MEAKELRKGNIVHQGMYGATPCRTQEIANFDREQLAPGTEAEYYKDWKPIPLTEEWLMKFGFEYDDETRTWSLLIGLNNFDYCFEIVYINNEVFIVLNNVEWCYKYVHQLQNLCFALTEVELEVKEVESNTFE